MVAVLAIAAAFALAARTAEAGERRTSITIEPLFLAIGMVAPSVEITPTPHLGLVAMAGVGHLPFTTASAWLWDLGARANVYPWRTSSGWHAGLEIYDLWGHMSIPLIGGTSSSSRIQELAAYAGYKWITRRGFTAILEYGIARMDTDGTDPMDDVPKHQIVPMGNLELGWSF